MEPVLPLTIPPRFLLNLMWHCDPWHLTGHKWERKGGVVSILLSIYPALLHILEGLWVERQPVSATGRSDHRFCLLYLPVTPLRSPQPSLRPLEKWVNDTLPAFPIRKQRQR